MNGDSNLSSEQAGYHHRHWRNGIEIARRTPPSDPRLQQTIDIMDRQLAHLVRLVDDLLDVNRISRGKMQFKIEPVRLAEVIAQSCESCRPLIDIQGHTLEIDAPDDSLMVKGDAHRLSQVISNLLSNSAKYTDPGGRIRVSLSREGDDAIVCVADNGIGMAPEDLGRVFDMFGQLEPGKSRSQRGLGIGLYLARRIIEMHGGTLTAASPGMGAGSTFTISLPVVSPPPESEPRSATPTTPSIPKLRIVIADDNRDGAESLALLLVCAAMRSSRQKMGWKPWSRYNDGDRTSSSSILACLGSMASKRPSASACCRGKSVFLSPP